jgi:hypothetical protein
MVRRPIVLGVTLCEDVVVDGATRNISLIRSFTGLAVDAFPATPAPFCAFAALTAGQGEATFKLVVERFSAHAVLDPIYTVAGTLRFPDPLQTVYWIVRVSRCSFPIAGEYLFTLWIDGAWTAQRRLRVYAHGKPL